MVIGLATTIVAALVMTTRVSVKVALAWSTCAQMGFMLVQCGLGLWPLALLHIVAHSLYKAYTFLGTGAVVAEWKLGALAAKRPGPSALRLGNATVVALGAALVALGVLRPALGLARLEGASALVFALLLGLSLVPLLAAGAPVGLRGAATVSARAASVVLLYVGWHALAEHMLPGAATGSGGAGALRDVGWWMTAVGFAGLFALKSTLQRHPNGALARTLHPWLFSGLYLDEFFTSLAFRVWPPRLAPREVASRGELRAPTPAGVQS